MTSTLEEGYVEKQEKVREEERENLRRQETGSIINFNIDGSNHHLRVPSNYFNSSKIVNSFMLSSTNILCYIKDLKENEPCL